MEHVESWTLAVDGEARRGLRLGWKVEGMDASRFWASVRRASKKERSGGREAKEEEEEEEEEEESREGWAGSEEKG